MLQLQCRYHVPSVAAVADGNTCQPVTAEQHTEASTGSESEVPITPLHDLACQSDAVAVMQSSESSEHGDTALPQ